MSPQWQSSTMCSSSLSSCCTSWTWCSFQLYPVGNRPSFSLVVCECVCACACVFHATSQAFNDPNSLGLQLGLATEARGGKHQWMWLSFSSRMPPMWAFKHVSLDCAWLPTGGQFLCHFTCILFHSSVGFQFVFYLPPFSFPECFFFLSLASFY